MPEENVAQEHNATSTPAVETAAKQRKPRGKPFKPGQSGNPAGRPPGTISLVSLLKRRLAEMSPDQQRTFGEVFIDNILQDAMDLDGPSRKLVMNYLEGMPKQQMIIDANKDTLGEITEFLRTMGGKPKQVSIIDVPPIPLAPPNDA